MSEPLIYEQEARKRRVGKACDSCRIKKTKCDGRKPCSKCLIDNKLCTYAEKRKQKDKIYPTGYVELLETRLDLLTRGFEKVLELSCNGRDVSPLKTVYAKFGINKVIEKLVEDYEFDDMDDLRKLQELEALQGSDEFLVYPGEDPTVGLVKREDNLSFGQEPSDASVGATRRARRPGRPRKSASETSALPATSPPSIPRTPLNVPSNSATVSATVSATNSATTTVNSTTNTRKPTLSADGLASPGTHPLSSTLLQSPSYELDLGPFTSGAAMAAAALNGNFVMSDFESDGLCSPAAGTSPYSDSEWPRAARVYNETLPTPDSLSLAGNGFLDAAAVSPAASVMTASGSGVGGVGSGNSGSSSGGIPVSTKLGRSSSLSRSYSFSAHPMAVRKSDSSNGIHKLHHVHASHSHSHPHTSTSSLHKLMAPGSPQVEAKAAGSAPGRGRSHSRAEIHSLFAREPNGTAGTAGTSRGSLGNVADLGMVGLRQTGSESRADASSSLFPDEMFSLSLDKNSNSSGTPVGNAEMEDTGETARAVEWQHGGQNDRNGRENAEQWVKNETADDSLWI